MSNLLEENHNCESLRIPVKTVLLLHHAQLRTTNKSSHREYKYFTTLQILHPINQTSSNKRFERQLGRIRYVRNFDIPNQLDPKHWKKVAQQIQHFSKTTKSSSNFISHLSPKDMLSPTALLVQKKIFKSLTTLAESEFHHDYSQETFKYQRDLHTLRLKIVGPRAEYDSLKSFMKVGASLKSLVSLEISSKKLPLFPVFFEIIRKLPRLRELATKSMYLPEFIHDCSFERIPLRKFSIEVECCYIQRLIFQNLGKAVQLEEIDIRRTTSMWNWNFMRDYNAEDELKKFLLSHGYKGIKKIPRQKKNQEFYFKDSRVTLRVSDDRFYLKKHEIPVN